MLDGISFCLMFYEFYHTLLKQFWLILYFGGECSVFNGEVSVEELQGPSLYRQF